MELKRTLRIEKGWIIWKFSKPYPNGYKFFGIKCKSIGGKKCKSQIKKK